jgi:integrase
MQGQRKRRPRGTGSIRERDGKLYGKFSVRGKAVERLIGPARQPGSKEGLTRTQAEARLREMMSELSVAPPPVVERITVKEAGDRLIRQLKLKQRKASTTDNYESILRAQLVPAFPQSLTQITDADVEDYIEDCVTEQGISVRSTLNYVGFLHHIFEFAIKKRWANANPCRTAEKPTRAEDTEIHFLDTNELEALVQTAGGRLKHTPESIQRHHAILTMRNEGVPWSAVCQRLGIKEGVAHYLKGIDPRAVSEDEIAFVELDPVLYLAAAMTGLRRGELLALRWMDVDWNARLIRVCQSYYRGRFTTPKGNRGRDVPLPVRVARALEDHSQRAAFTADADLVFCHPHTGGPLDDSHLHKRFKRALRRAGVREIRFHDLRHTFGTRCAASGIEMRTLQEWMGHRDCKTTLRYAAYAPKHDEAARVDAAFGDDPSTYPSTKVSKTQRNPEVVNPVATGETT